MFFILKYLAFFYATCVVFMQYMTLGYLVLSAQRWGWLLHGKSFYLPHHTPESMRKTGMSYRNIFFTIAHQRGYSRRDIERMILLPTNPMLELSPLVTSTMWRPPDNDIEEVRQCACASPLFLCVFQSLASLPVQTSVRPPVFFLCTWHDNIILLVRRLLPTAVCHLQQK